MADPIDPDSPPTAADLAVTEFLDFDHPAVAEFAANAAGGLADPVEQAVALFAKVRDSIWYDPYTVSTARDDMRASAVLEGRQRWCVPKAVLLTASCRAVGIPARLGFADVRNHLQSDTLRQKMGTDVFVWHGFSVMWLDGAWRKASPAFNRELCERFGTAALAFDGRSDALLHAFTGDGRRYMEYLVQRGTYDDLPLERILATFAELRAGREAGDGDGSPASWSSTDDPAFAEPERTAS